MARTPEPTRGPESGNPPTTQACYPPTDLTGHRSRISEVRPHQAKHAIPGADESRLALLLGDEHPGPAVPRVLDQAIELHHEQPLHEQIDSPDEALGVPDLHLHLDRVAEVGQKQSNPRLPDRLTAQVGTGQESPGTGPPRPWQSPDGGSDLGGRGEFAMQRVIGRADARHGTRGNRRLRDGIRQGHHGDACQENRAQCSAGVNHDPRLAPSADDLANQINLLEGNAVQRNPIGGQSRVV